MTPSNASGASSDAERLDELAEVTREYARYSRTKFGLAWVATGVWLLAYALSDVAGLHWAAQIGYVLGPLVSLLAIRSARSWYQRHGAVVEHEPDVGVHGLRSVYLIPACGWMVLNGLTLAWDARAWVRANGALAWGACAVGVAGSLAAAVLAPRLVRGAREALGLLGFSMVVRVPGSHWTDDAVVVAMRTGGVVLIATLLVAVGVRQHWTYRALERRLAGSKAQA